MKIELWQSRSRLHQRIFFASKYSLERAWRQSEIYQIYISLHLWNLSDLKHSSQMLRSFHQFLRKLHTKVLQCSLRFVLRLNKNLWKMCNEKLAYVSMQVVGISQLVRLSYFLCYLFLFFIWRPRLLGRRMNNRKCPNTDSEEPVFLNSCPTKWTYRG